MEAEPKRWYQFSLRTLLIGVTLLAVPLGYVGWNLRIVEEQKAWLSGPLLIEPVFVRDGPSSRIPWIRRMLGDSECFLLIIEESVTDADLDACRAAFPEAIVCRDREEPTVKGKRLKFHINKGRTEVDRIP